MSLTVQLVVFQGSGHPGRFYFPFLIVDKEVQLTFSCLGLSKFMRPLALASHRHYLVPEQ